MTEGVLQENLWVSLGPRVAAPPAVAVTERPPTGVGRRPVWRPTAVLVAAAVGGLALFLVSLRGVDLSGLNGLGLLAALPPGAVVAVIVIALAFMVGLAFPRAHPVGLGALVVSLVVCLDGVTAFVEVEPRFPTAYQISGFVDYVSRTGHTAPGLAAYFSWPGFFSLVSLVGGAAGTHGLLSLMTVWPVVVDALCLPALFLLMRNLRFSWRARWLAAFFFSVGNWVGQDYFSPQSFCFLLYIVFVAILVNWFTDPAPRPALRVVEGSAPVRLHRRFFGRVEPGERPPRPATTGQRAFLLVLLVAMFGVATVSHQLTPVFMIAACAGLVVIRRCTMWALPVLLGVIFVGYLSFGAVGYWSGHLSDLFGGIGALGTNVSTSVGSRLTGSSSTHLLALHGREGLAAVIVVLAVLGMVRRRRAGFDDRVLLMLVVVPVLLVGVASYGGEIVLRTYLFLLPAASVFAAAAIFPRAQAVRTHRLSLLVLAGCAVVLPVAFFLARYGNESYEQIPQGELAATNWVYAHDAHGVRLLWLSTDPATDVTPDMPWAYRDLTKLAYVPTQAPRHPTSVGSVLSDLRQNGPGSYLIVDQTQVAALQQTASYPAGWGSRFERALRAAPDVRVAFRTDSATVYTLHWPAGTKEQPLGVATAASVPGRFTWTEAGEIVLWLLVVVLGAIELVRLWRPSARLRLLWIAAAPLFVVFMGDVALRFAVLA